MLPRQLFWEKPARPFIWLNINKVLNCKTTHCQGKLIPTSFKLKGLGRTIVVTYNCSECGLRPIDFTTNKPVKDSTRSEVATALHVAFIISGGTHATYRRVIHHGLGMEAFGNSVFASVIESLYLVVKRMVDDLCEDEMKSKWTPMLWVGGKRQLLLQTGAGRLADIILKIIHSAFITTRTEHFSTSVNVVETNWATLHCTRDVQVRRSCLVELKKRGGNGCCNTVAGWRFVFF